MRFSENGYYIEKYVKCANCGLLIYDEGIRVQTRLRFIARTGASSGRSCANSGKDYFQLPIVQPTIKTVR